MRIFMLGWEFPLFISGGLGTACYGLTRAMSRLDIGVVIALPRLVGQTAEAHVKIVGPELTSDRSGDFKSMRKYCCNEWGQGDFNYCPLVWNRSLIEERKRPSIRIVTY